VIHLLARMDDLASAGRSPWHHSSALAKLLVAAAVVGLTIAAPALRLLLAVHAVAWVLVLTSGMPLRLAALAAAYPLPFVALVVMGRWDGSWQTPLALGLKPVTAALAAAWLVGTTPYPDLFAPLSRVLPRAVGDGLFMTYRALFALHGSAEHLWQALRLRGGWSGPARRRLALAGEGLGTLVVQGFERSGRLYAAMLLRGHSGRICGCRHFAELTPADAWAALPLAALAAATLLLWRAP
jgi:cobalt/nickel transport system permease protein